MVMEPTEAGRVRIFLRGMLQGMGFRPFIYNVAKSMGLKGWVRNLPQGVLVEAEGEFSSLQNFIRCIGQKAPPQARVQEMESSFLEPQGYEAFTILPSEGQERPSSFIMPDLATCRDCLEEIFDPNNRRYFYPFTHCVRCGPRYSIIESLPYDRERTSMKHFAMCEHCEWEYRNPEDRRFHAQSNACAECGPQLELWDAAGKVLSSRNDALKGAAKALLDGSIIAMKGLGGLHLMVDAKNKEAVANLRLRKNREEKPFALMFPSLEEVREVCDVSVMEADLLCSSESPIVLLNKRKREENRPGCVFNPLLGVMLPYTPLHHIFMKEVRVPVVATSGNLADETLCTDERQALVRLKGVADFFLVHNRPIVRHVDDSIVRTLMEREQVLRRARGYAPVTFKDSLPSSIAVGGDLKNTVAVSEGKEVFISPHIGDLQNAQTYSAFETTLASLSGSPDRNPDTVSCDFHPDYLSTRWAEENTENCVYVQHHVAHILSCMAENQIEGPVLGVAWDGSGYGLDGTVWGGEFFHITAESFHRIACWRPFPLPGGERAVREPRRSALGLLYEMMGPEVFGRPALTAAFSQSELHMLQSMLANGTNCPRTSSCGRLFDAVASIIGVRQVCSYEGQSAMELEFSAEGGNDHYPFNLQVCDGSQRDSDSTFFVPPYYDLSLRYVLDWEPLINALLHDRLAGEVSPNEMSMKFHNSLVESIIAVAKKTGEEQVVLSGGCFQNKLLTEKAIQRIKQAGLKPIWHQRIPTNDGGLALGQIKALQWTKERVSCV